jgi:hypothetical protein
MMRKKRILLDPLRSWDLGIRGLLLIIAILLVGTGFTFIKHVLSERERKLFIIAIPLQVYIDKY